MNYLDIKHCDMVNGTGLRTVIWFAGCNHNCSGCFSQHTHDPKAGIKFDKAAKDELFRDLTEDWCEGVTLLGGDPLFPDNRVEVICLAKELKEKFPTKTIWLYTGYCWNDIIADDTMSEIVKYVDVICDGPFVESLKDANLQWVGSSNQHVIDVRERFAKIASLSSNAVAQNISV